MPAQSATFNRYALSAVRKAHGLKQDEVATGIDCNPGYYSRLESGARSPSPELVQRMAAFLKVDVRVLDLEAAMAEAAA